MKGLENVSVKNVPYITPNGQIVPVPGPFAIELPNSRTPTILDDDEEPEDEAPDEEDENPENEDDDDANDPVFAGHLNRQKFVVRNEFGHVRIQNLLEGIESTSYGQATDPRHHFDVGGHCVLPKDIFNLCIEKGWGQPHMLSGRFHPIAGTVIPETTLLFYAPRNEDELEIVWKILRASYEWALSDIPQEHKAN